MFVCFVWIRINKKGCISDLKINDIDISLGDFIQPFNTIDRPNTLSNNDNDGRRIINEQQQWPIDSSNHPSLSHSNINLMAVKNQQQHKTKMKHAKPNNNNNNDDQNKEMIIEISITKQQNIRNGCQSPPINSCIELHCRKPFICIDEWMVAKCRSVSHNTFLFSYLFFCFVLFCFVTVNTQINSADFS